MVEALAKAHEGFTSLYIHVDDISALTKARSGKQLVARATSFAKDFAKWANVLKLDISDKTKVIPDNADTRQFAANANKLGIPMKVDKQGEDIGVDTSSASRRATQPARNSITSKGPR